MAQLPISNGNYALVDEADYELLKDFRWYQLATGYVFRLDYSEGKNGIKYLHRDIMDAKKGELVDHANLQKADNRRSNLRIATPSQNSFNQRRRIDNSSGYAGVDFRKRDRKWRARIAVEGKRLSLGLFDNPHDAARMYNFWAHDIYGEFAQLNVIKEGAK